MIVMLVSVGKFYLKTESISNVFLSGKEEEGAEGWGKKKKVKIIFAPLKKAGE